MTDRYQPLRDAIAGLPEVAQWYVVGPPWGKGDFVVAGNPDPHVGKYVCDTEDFDGDKPHSLEYAEYIAAASPDTIAALLAENDKLRYLLALRIAGHRLYGDDGHLQDNTQFPFIDFRFDSADEIAAKLDERARAALADGEATNAG